MPTVNAIDATRITYTMSCAPPARIAITQAKIDAALNVSVEAIGIRSSCQEAREPAVRPAA